MDDLAAALARQTGGRAAERLTVLLRAASDAFFEVDVRARRIVWSRGIQLLFGHDPERIGERLDDWQALAHPDDLEELVRSGREVVRTRATSWSDEFRLARADGSYAPVRVRAFFLHDEDDTRVVGSVTDLSAQKEIEAELRSVSAELSEELARERQARTRAELLMRSATSEVLAEWMIATGEMHWSPNVAEVLGYGPDQLPNVDAIVERIHPEDRDASIGALRRVVEGGGTAWSGLVRFLSPNGTYETVDARAYVLRDDSGGAIMCVGSVRPAGTRVRPALTPRQEEVLRLIRLGQTNKEVAGRLGISEQAAKVQVSKLLRKFGVGNRAALVAANEPREVSG